MAVWVAVEVRSLMLLKWCPKFKPGVPFGWLAVWLAAIGGMAGPLEFPCGFLGEFLGEFLGVPWRVCWGLLEFLAVRCIPPGPGLRRAPNTTRVCKNKCQRSVHWLSYHWLSHHWLSLY